MVQEEQTSGLLRGKAAQGLEDHALNQGKATAWLGEKILPTHPTNSSLSACLKH